MRHERHIGRELPAAGKRDMSRSGAACSVLPDTSPLRPHPALSLDPEALDGRPTSPGGEGSQVRPSRRLQARLIRRPLVRDCPRLPKRLVGRTGCGDCRCGARRDRLCTDAPLRAGPPPHVLQARRRLGLKALPVLRVSGPAPVARSAPKKRGGDSAKFVRRTRPEARNSGDSD